ncbi:NUDIX domain-containing protein [Streptosporangium sp. NPDC051023]|uniref:NUDIX hydrolase n=1 Tax=Streptosporangium sp. NPDC051023 TaxID=3155410 RepID=UPI00344C41CB
MPEAILRPSARILLVDDRDRILLYRGLGLMRDSGYAWFTPGGGVNDGETLNQAAARELREEAGHSVTPEALGHVVATSSGHWYHADGRLFRSFDSFFFLRAGKTEVDTSNMEDLERSMIDDFRWWSLPELHGTDERIIPLGLTGLLERLLTGDIPAEPVVFPWHHPDPFA